MGVLHKSSPKGLFVVRNEELLQQCKQKLLKQKGVI
jgi:hypothetical protein